MFLKRAVLQGFKSFADRTEFEFGAGITCIVGPNGCGKSNILDAIRWVLGEQSAKTLRGDRMEDVIFSGSRSRKPGSFAEVELTFDNSTGILRCDLPEVVVARILWRSGESEYRLNGEPCRRKDIRELLVDTGVGVDGYGVIEQGRVERLLEANPLERRETFEEAAGISRYKARRLEAQRKLERTQNNLLRLGDIIDEVEKRLRSVRLAAGKARNYQQYDARLRELRLTFSLAEYHELEQQRTRIRSELDELTGALAAERTRLAELDAAAAELAGTLQQADDAVLAADAALHEVRAVLRGLAERLTQSTQRLEDARGRRARQILQCEELARQRAALAERQAAEQAALNDLRQAEQAALAHSAALEQERAALERRCEELRADLERARLASFEAARRVALLQSECANLQQQEQRLAGAATRLAARQREVDESLQRQQQQCAELRSRLEELETREAALTAAHREGEAQLGAQQAEADRLDEQIAQARERRTALASRLALLEDMERRLEGVDAGTRAVLAWRDEPGNPGAVVGLVADLLRIDDPRVAALQAVLATCESHVVVRDTAAFLAEWLRRGLTAGPVRVLGLDRVPVRPLASGYEGTPGFVARASEWVRCADEYRPLAEQLLGRTIVVDTLERAQRLAAEALAGYAFVSLDGWTVFADGRLMWGAAAGTPGLISRKAEIRQLQGELEELEAHLVALTRQRLTVEQAISDLQLRRRAELEEIAALQREVVAVRTDLARGDDACQRLSHEAALVAAELSQQQRGLEELTDQQRQRAAEIEAARAEQQAREDELERLAQALAELEADAADRARAGTAALVECGRAGEKRRAAEETLRELDRRATDLAAAEQQAHQEAHAAEEQIRLLEEDIRTTLVEQQRREAEAAQKEADGLRLRERRQQLRVEAEQRGAEIREVQRRIEAAESVFHEKQVQQRENEIRQETLVARVRDELALDLPARYATYEHVEQDWAAIRAEIEELRGKLARLGNVNLDALAELEELTPRYEHLVAQRSDLVASVERLQTLIADLDAESRTRFLATFERVRANFQEMFRKLFGGGKADILLEDPERPLECGIEILARPPGKEPQSISLLSGGEKTLAAVALLLGVFKCRPSPFAILDEVDAALDESNTERFNSVLQEFLSHTQFVVITHSKRTMASADVLYGITMEEPGVSKRVSVRFEERVQTPSVA